MSWVRIALAALAGGIASSMTDWLFMGDWLYKRYDRHPEIWRPESDTLVTYLTWIHNHLVDDVRVGPA